MQFLVLLPYALMELIMLESSILRIKSKIYMGIDCSSKAIHSVWVDSHESILTQCKWWSKEKDFDTRFFDFGEDFWDDLSKIKVILDSGSTIQAMVEAPIYIQNPKATIAIASVTGLVRFTCFLTTRCFTIKFIYFFCSKFKKLTWSCDWNGVTSLFCTKLCK